MKKMKVLSLLLALLLVLSSVSVAFAEEAVVTSETVEGETPVVEVLPKKVKLNKTSLKLEMYSGFQLEAFVTPTEATDQTVFYESNKPSVATVSEDGYIQALSKGKATITAKTVNGKKATCKVTVKKGPEMDAWSKALYEMRVRINSDNDDYIFIPEYSKTLSKAANYCLVKYFKDNPNSDTAFKGYYGDVTTPIKDIKLIKLAQEALDLFGIKGTLIGCQVNPKMSFSEANSTVRKSVPPNILYLTTGTRSDPNCDYFSAAYVGYSVINTDSATYAICIYIYDDFSVSETKFAKDWTTTYMRVATPKDIVSPVPIA